MSEIELISIAVAAIVVIGIAAQWIAWRFGVPSILLRRVFIMTEA